MDRRRWSRCAARLPGGVLVVGALLVTAWPAGAAPPGLPAPFLDPSADRVLARTPVPDAARKVGEVRLVARGDATVVQTLLRTKVLARVVGEIRKKEAANWPPDAAGHGDMLRYVDTVAGAAAAAPADDQRRQRLLIEFVAAPGGVCGVRLATFSGDEVDGALAPGDIHTVALLALGRAYVFPNMRFILADAFGIPVTDVERIGPLGPLANPS